MLTLWAWNQQSRHLAKGDYLPLRAQIQQNYNMNARMKYVTILVILFL